MREFSRRLMSLVGLGIFFTAGAGAVQAQDVIAAVYQDLGAKALQNAAETPSIQNMVSNTQTGRIEPQSGSSRLVVDRIEGNEAILETSAGAVRFPLEALPAGAAHEGAVLVWRHTQSEENHRISAARARIERMKAASHTL